VPFIEAVRDDSVLSKNEIRLDAIFRQAMASNDRSVFWLLAKPLEAHIQCYAVLEEVAARDPGDSTTADRLRALRSLASFAATRPPNEVSLGLRWILEEFGEIEGSLSLTHGAEILTAEEEKAIFELSD